MKRNASVELSRIIACMMVIGVHTILPSCIDGIYDTNRVLISCLVGDGVAIFWIITGFFLFHSSNYQKLCVRVIKNIIVPMVLFTLFTFYCYEWIVNGIPFTQGLKRSADDYLFVIKNTIMFNTIWHTGHLWFLFAYLLVILIFPVLKSFVLYLEQSKRREHIFLLISFGLFLVNDITENQLFQFSHHGFNAAIPAAIEVIWGHILYQHREKFSKPRYMIQSILTFLVLNILRLMIQLNRYQSSNPNNWILYWFSSIGLICAVNIVILGFSVFRSQTESLFASLVCRVASYTFCIYLIHPVIIDLLQKHGITSQLTQMGDGFYTVSIIFIVFILSLVIAVCIQVLRKVFLYLWALIIRR